VEELNINIEKAQQGDKTAMQLLIDQYQPLIISFAKKKYVSNQFEETYQEAVYAFIMAVKEYDAEYGVYFGTYIKQRIWRYLSSKSRKNNKWNQVIFVGEWKEDFNSLLSETIDMDFVVWQEQLANVLSEREQQFVQLVLIDGYTPKEVADRLGVSTSTVKTWRKRALKKLQISLLGS